MGLPTLPAAPRRWAACPAPARRSPSATSCRPPSLPLRDEMLLRPAVRLRVERLAGTGEEAQARQVVFLRRLLAVAHPHADRGRRGEHEVDAEALDQLPGDLGRRIVRHALAAEYGRADRQRPVDDERMADDPADVRGAPVDVALADLVEGARQVGHADHVPAGGVNDAFRLPGGARGVEDEQRVSESIGSGWQWISRACWMS